MKRKVYITVPCMNSGGAERVLYLLAKGLKDYYEVIFIFMNYEICKFDLDNFKILYIGNLTLVKKIKYFKSLMNKEKDSFFISFYDEIGMILTFAKGFKKNKVILSVRNDPRTFPRKKLIPIRNLLFKNCTHMVFQTNDAKEYFAKKIQNKSSIILNPIKFKNDNEFVGDDRRKKKFVAFSRLTKQKNIPMMIDAFCFFSKQHPEYCLDIYGSKDDDYVNIVNLIKEKNSNNIFLKEFDPDLKFKLNEYAAFISSSNFEGISNSMLESLSIGLPSICTDCPIGGTKMFIIDGINGYKVPINDYKKMADAMEKLISNKNIYKTTYDNIDILKKKIDEDVIIEEWKKLMLSL